MYSLFKARVFTIACLIAGTMKNFSQNIVVIAVVTIFVVLQKFCEDWGPRLKISGIKNVEGGTITSGSCHSLVTSVRLGTRLDAHILAASHL